MLQFLIDVLMRTSDLLLVSVGLSTLYSLIRFPNIAHVQYAMIGAFATLGFERAGLPFALATAVSCVLVGLAATLLNLFVFTRLLRSGSAAAMIGSLAVSLLAVALMLGAAGSRPLQYAQAVRPPLMVGGVAISSSQAGSIACGAAALGVFALLLYRTRLGRAMRALASNRALALATGIDAQRVTNVITFASGVLAALGGTMLGATESVHVNLGYGLLIPVFSAAILGGLGNPLGAAAGALLIAFAETTALDVDFGGLVGRPLAFFPVEYVGAVSFAILLVALAFRPYGIFDREVRRV
ncbi:MULTISPECIES: branched-chain amino acid ABC transporter permease [Burkholderia cepacia complex]|uniref:branched-chain amino acid ABC transporter permease n=1 Tax=Burkholderia cepacia complex TaxID=87882 RepID=UPI00064C4116|nr:MULTISPECIES: branched-chain amino acid ABC transporter permease [Burkholderia cepacia complex]AKM04795.1 ABC transporter permease [Burkholderia pyrrocinia]GAU07048.1 ABC transporter permease [Burkholderia stabilis]